MLTSHSGTRWREGCGEHWARPEATRAVANGTFFSNHCPSEIGSTRKERRYRPGATSIWRSGQQIHPALLPSITSQPSLHCPTLHGHLPPGTAAHPGREDQEDRADVGLPGRPREEAGPHPRAPSPSSQAQPVASEITTAAALFPPGPLPNLNLGVGEGWVGPSSTAFPPCFFSRGHGHPLCLIKSRAFQEEAQSLPSCHRVGQAGGSSPVGSQGPSAASLFLPWKTAHTRSVCCQTRGCLLLLSI